MALFGAPTATPEDAKNALNVAVAMQKRLLTLNTELAAIGYSEIAVGIGLHTGEAAIRQGVFQVVSMMTTTGYASTDFIIWPAFALMILVGVMLVGGSAGSTGRPGASLSTPMRCRRQSRGSRYVSSSMAARRQRLARSH